MKISIKVFFTVVGCALAAGLGGYEVGINRNVMLTIRNNKENTPQPTQAIQQKNYLYFYNDEKQFPILDVPKEYLVADEKNISMGAGSGYNVIRDDALAYQSYPTATISLDPRSYSTTATAYKSLGPQPKAPSDRIVPYGERRFDVDKDGKEERLLGFSLMGANVGESWEEIVKDNKVIFDASGNDYTKIVPTKDGNGFFLEWNDNYKMFDGYMRTRFVYDGTKFVPVYEQQIRYVRIRM